MMAKTKSADCHCSVFGAHHAFRAPGTAMMSSAPPTAMPTPHQITLVGIDSVDICAPLLSRARAGYRPRRLSRDKHVGMRGRTHRGGVRGGAEHPRAVDVRAGVGVLASGSCTHGLAQVVLYM